MSNSYVFHSHSLRADKLGKLENAIEILKEAIVIGKRVIRVQEVLALGTTSKRMLYRAYEDHAVCHINLAKFYGRQRGEHAIHFIFQKG